MTPAYSPISHADTARATSTPPTQEKPLIVSAASEPAAVLRARFDEWGYLYFRQYVDRARCNALLHDIIGELAPHIAFNEAQQKPLLRGEPIVETDAHWDAIYPRIQALENFHAFFHTPEIQALMKTVTGRDDVFVYPMKMARVSTPQRIGYETPPHQDARSHAAGATMAGMWIPLQDVNASMGRLKMLPRSHKRGVRPVYQSPGVGNVACEIYQDETEWHVSDVQQGDVIIFHACCVHAAQPNTSDNAVRLSVDTRFCDYGAPVSRLNLTPHHGWRIPVLDWDYIYRNWQDTALQYYWRDYPNFW